MNSQSTPHNDEAIILASSATRALKMIVAALDKFIERRRAKLATEKNISAAYSNAYHRSMNKQG